MDERSAEKPIFFIYGYDPCRVSMSELAENTSGQRLMCIPSTFATLPFFPCLIWRDPPMTGPNYLIILRLDLRLID